MSGAKHRAKGNRVEREIVQAFKELGVHAERYPLSGASHFRDSGHDLDVYAFGREEAPIVCEVKARKDGKGFVQLESWLGEYDALLLKRNNAAPLVCLPWQVFVRLMLRSGTWRPGDKKRRLEETSPERDTGAGLSDGGANGRDH